MVSRRILVKDKRTILLDHCNETRASQICTKPQDNRIIVVVMLGFKENVVKRFLRRDIEKTRIPRVGILSDQIVDSISLLSYSQAHQDQHYQSWLEHIIIVIFNKFQLFMIKPDYNQQIKMGTNQDKRQTLRFQQYFADQDINLDDYIYEELPNFKATADIDTTKYTQNDQLAIQLIKKKNDGQFVLNTSAVELICSYDKPVALVCLAGKYRTGKSFLLNKLLDLKGKCFNVSNSTDACTEGIWIWSRPIYNKKQDCLIFMIDTEGSEATNRNAEHDAKIFTLGILISSYFIYNSVGAIDEPSINELSLVTTLSKSMATNANLSQQSLHRYMPKFLWLLRDFVLEIRDQYGQQKTPNQYLEYSLDAKKGSQQTKNTKRALTTIFRDRQCMMLIRPADNEQDLKMLNQIPSNKLRSQFIQGINVLKRKILNNTSPKIVNGEPLTTNLLCQMIQKYVESINKGAIPNILSAWEHLGEETALQAYDAALEAYSKKFDLYFSDDSAKQSELLNKILKQMRDEALDTFDFNVDGPSQKLRNKLKTLLDEKQRMIILINEEYNESFNIKLLKEYSQHLVHNVESGKYSSENPQVLNQDLNRMIARYNADAHGEKKCEVLTLFLTNFNAMIFKSYNDTTNSKLNMRRMRNDNTQKDNRQFQKQIQLMHEQLQSAKRQIQLKDNNSNRQIEQQRRKLRQARQEATSIRKQLDAILNKKKKTKCCFF